MTGWYHWPFIHTLMFLNAKWTLSDYIHVRVIAAVLPVLKYVPFRSNDLRAISGVHVVTYNHAFTSPLLSSRQINLTVTTFMLTIPRKDGKNGLHPTLAELYDMVVVNSASHSMLSWQKCAIMDVWKPTRSGMLNLF